MPPGAWSAGGEGSGRLLHVNDALVELSGALARGAAAPPLRGAAVPQAGKATS
jgi:hypothetical protein